MNHLPSLVTAKPTNWLTGESGESFAILNLTDGANWQRNVAEDRPVVEEPKEFGTRKHSFFPIRDVYFEFR